MVIKYINVYLSSEFLNMKKFIIIGSINAACYRDIFPYIKDNEVWLGVKKGLTMTFNTDNGDVDVAAWWYTNLSHSKRNVPLELNKKYNPLDYPKYDNFDAINVNKVADIPSDYCGVMGVPLTFLEKYCPDQFEIVGKTGGVEWLKECEFFTPPSAEEAKRYRKQNRDWGVHHAYLLDSDGKPRITYRRLFIKRRNQHLNLYL